jgi:hypothetical protein
MDLKKMLIVLGVSSSVSILVAGCEREGSIPTDSSDSSPASAQEETAGASEPGPTSSSQAGNALATIPSPVAIAAMPVTGSGENRKAGLKVTNKGDQAISKLGLTLFYYGADGRLMNQAPYTNTEDFEKGADTLGKGDHHVVDMSGVRIRDDAVVAVGGIVRSLTWKDGTTWPAWTGPAPDAEGETPVSLVMKGVVRQGKLSTPLIEAFNQSDERIKSVEYRISYLDEAGTVLRKGGRSFIRNLTDPGKGFAFLHTEGPPEGAASVTLELRWVLFEDDREWQP